MINKKFKNLTIAALIALLFAGVTLLNSCKNPIEGFVLTIKADYTTSPNTFRILDAKTNAAAAIPDFTVIKITGKDASLVFEPSGSKTIKLVDGAIQLAFRKGVNPTKANPLLFNIEVNTNGYLPVIYPVEICSVQPVTQNISLVNTAALPSGSSLVKNTVTTDNLGKITTSISIINGVANGKNESAIITIPSGTQLQDANGVVVSGAVNATLVHFTGSSIAAINSFPGGLHSNKVKAKDGTSLPGGSFNPVSWLLMDMTVGSKEVKKFSQPVSAVLEVSANSINPLTHSVYKEGDNLLIWSKSNGDEFWIKESIAAITKNTNSGKLEVTMLMTHLSTWVAANFSEACSQDIKITITNNENNFTNAAISLYKKIDNTSFAYIGEFSTSCNPGQNIINLKDYFPDFTFTESDLFKAMIVFDGANTLFIGPSSFCGALLPANVPVANRSTIDYKLSIKCNQNFILLSDNYRVYYVKEADYQNTIINDPAPHKINPYDLNSSGLSYYKMVLAHTVPGNANYSLLSLLKSSLDPGVQYRCILYYQNQRYDKLFTAPIKSVLDAGQTQDLVVTIDNCPM